MTAGGDPLFDRGGWWDPAVREFASLRAISAFRLDLLRRWLPGSWDGRTVVDLGSGGGLLAVPLAALGAIVVGVDRARRALDEARRHGGTTYCGVAGDLMRCPLPAGAADVVLLADVLEHVEDPAAAVREAARLLRTGGHLFVNTIDRTLRSRLLAIVLGEGLGFVPRGTHVWKDFVRPQELDAMAAFAGLSRRELTGESPRPWRTLRSGAIALRESRSTAVGYAAQYRLEVA
jgi:2-polyprenyl-6-hydroxyphenyl methylase/3-demethylubiquinone-9 3-methyltransferase